MGIDVQGAVMKLVPLIYDAALNPSRWDLTTEQIARTVGAARGELGTTDSRFTSGIFGRFEFPDALLEEAIRSPEAFQWIASKGWSHGHTFSIDDLAPSGNFHETSAYQDVVKKWDIHSMVLSTLPADPTQPSAMQFAAVMGDNLRKPLGDGALHILRELSPHISRGLDMLRHQRRRQALEESGWEALSVGVAVLDGSETVRFLNREARRILNSQDGLHQRAGRLEAETPDITWQFHRLIGEAATALVHRGSGSGGLLTLPRPSGKSPLLVRVTPLARDNPWSSGKYWGAALVFIEDLHRPARAAADALRKLYGLTPFEAQITTRLADGRSPTEVASALGTTPKTVRVQMERIYSKMGVRRQAQLVKLVLRLEQGLYDAFPTPTPMPER